MPVVRVIGGAAGATDGGGGVGAVNPGIAPSVPFFGGSPGGTLRREIGRSSAVCVAGDFFSAFIVLG